MAAMNPVELARSQVREASEVLASAFYDDPTMLLPGAKREKRARTLPWVMSSFLMFGHLFGNVYATPGEKAEQQPALLAS